MVAFTIVFVACKSENEEEYFGKTGTGLTACDTVYVVYSEHIKPMFEYNCVSCHMDQMVIDCDLDNYENTLDYVTRTGSELYDYVKDNTHQGVVLDSCQLKQLSKWVKNPAP